MNVILKELLEIQIKGLELLILYVRENNEISDEWLDFLRKNTSYVIDRGPMSSKRKDAVCKKMQEQIDIRKNYL